jgi:hypothetical protein
MKKIILFILGVFVACVAAYSLPKEIKKEPIRDILKEYHLISIDHATVAVPMLNVENFSPGYMQIIVKPYTLKIESRFAITNLNHPRYLARSGLSLKHRKLWRDIQRRRL